MPRPGIFVLLLLILSGPGQAQARPASEQGRAGVFDYYVLALSWSPSYCLINRGDRAQCSKGYGFVLHGLWPQYEAKGYPESCVTGSALTPVARRVGETTFPSPKLMIHEWDKHGTCSGLDAKTYFERAGAAFAQVDIPDAFEAPQAAFALSAEDIVAAFAAANPRYPRTSFAVVCRGRALSEIRLCLSRDLKARACGGAIRSQCPAAPIRVQPVRSLG